MNQKFTNTLQFITIFSVIVGTALVVWELQQTRTLSRLALSQETYNSISQEISAVLGDDFSNVYARSCLEPESLTPADYAALHHYYVALELRAQRPLRTETDGGLSTRWRLSAQVSLGAILSSKPGREWWKLTPHAPELAEEAIKMVKDFEGIECRDFFNNWMTSTQQLINPT